MARGRIVGLALLLCAMLASVGCIHKSTPVTPWERVMTDNAILAQFADTAEQGTELAVTSGLMTTATARPVILFEDKFSVTHKQITAILAQGQLTANLPQVQVLLTQLQTEGDALVASGNIGIKNPKTQMTITADINNILALTRAVLTDIQVFQSGGAK